MSDVLPLPLDVELAKPGRFVEAKCAKHTPLLRVSHSLVIVLSKALPEKPVSTDFAPSFVFSALKLTFQMQKRRQTQWSGRQRFSGIQCLSKVSYKVPSPQVSGRACRDWRQTDTRFQLAFAIYDEGKTPTPAILMIFRLI